jgi:hypothetical protein
VASLLHAASTAVGVPRILSCANLHPDMRDALKESLGELESSFNLPEAAELRESLNGFWKLVASSSDATASEGITGCAGYTTRTALGSYSLYSAPDEYSADPTAQTVEVVADHRQGRSVTAVLKGDVYCGKLASTGELGVVEDYTKLEYGEERQGDGTQLEPVRWSCTYLGAKLRVARTDDGGVRVYTRADGSAAQDEMTRLLAEPVEMIADEDEMADDEIDDRPLWQRRLEEEQRRDGTDRFGPQGSDIP